MQKNEETTRVWETGRNVEEIHALLCESDAFHAGPGSPVPARNIETTKSRVESGSVHVLSINGEAAAMFTLTFFPPFARDLSVFPAANHPAYLSRLAIRPKWLEIEPLLGAICLKKAVEIAVNAGADAIRAEANPDLTRVYALLRMFNFEECARHLSDKQVKQAYLQKTLAGKPPGVTPGG